MTYAYVSCKGYVGILKEHAVCSMKQGGTAGVLYSDPSLTEK